MADSNALLAFEVCMWMAPTIVAAKLAFGDPGSGRSLSAWWIIAAATTAIAIDKAFDVQRPVMLHVRRMAKAIDPQTSHDGAHQTLRTAGLVFIAACAIGGLFALCRLDKNWNMRKRIATAGLAIVSLLVMTRLTNFGRILITNQKLAWAAELTAWAAVQAGLVAEWLRASRSE